MDGNVDVVLVTPIAPSTSCDEAIALALQEECESGEVLVTVAEPRDTEGAPREPLPPSAPPLPPEGAGWTAGSDSHTQEAALMSRDELLARDLQEEEIQQLSQAERDRLAALPGVLPEPAMVRTLSEKLASLAGVTFTKLIPQVNPASAAQAAAAAAEQQREVEPSGRALLDKRLKLYCLVERVMKGDGACQFRSLSDQLYWTPRLHQFVRQMVCKQLRQHPEWYLDHVPGDYQRYCADMAQASTWGDHVSLQAAADVFGLRIWVLTSYESSCFLEIEPREQRSSRVLLLSFFAEVHYNSVVSADEPPRPVPDDKLLGSRRLHALIFGRPY